MLTFFLSAQNGHSDTKLQYVYGTCNVNGCINEDGSGDSPLLPIGLFKLFSSCCRDLLVCNVELYVQPSQKIHVTERDFIK